MLTVAVVAPEARAADRDLLVGTMPMDQTVNQGGIQRFDGATGAFLGYFVAPGAGGLNSPLWFIFGPDGNLYVSDTSGVERFNGVTGAFIDDFVVPGSDRTRGGLAFGRDGNLYLASSSSAAGNWKIARYDGTTGAETGSFSASWPAGVAFGPDDKLYIAERYVDSSGTVKRYDAATGEFMGTFAVPSGVGTALEMRWFPRVMADAGPDQTVVVNNIGQATFLLMPAGTATPTGYTLIGTTRLSVNTGSKKPTSLAINVYQKQQ